MSSTQFVEMYHPLIPSTATEPVLVALQSVDDHAAHGWLLVDPDVDPPAPATPYYTRAELLSQIQGGAAPVGTALRAAYVPKPSGGTDGQALVKSGTDVAWGAAGLTGAQIAADPTVKAAFERRLRIDVRDYMIGGEVTGASVNAALDDAEDPGLFGEIILSPGYIETDEPIRFRQGVLITGGGAHDAASSRPGTEFGPAPGYAGVGFTFAYDGANLLHHSGLVRVRVKGFASHGIHILGGLGEGTVFDLIAAQANGGDGVRIEGPSTPSMIGRIGVYSNTGAGLRLVQQNQTHTQILYLAGDNNGESLMTVDKLDGKSSVQVVSWKGERWNRAPLPYGHPNVFVINDGNGGLIDLGTGRVQVGTGATAGNAVVLQTAPTGSVGRVTGRYSINDSSGTGGYTYGYQDTKNAQSYTVAQTERRLLRVGEPVAAVPTSGQAYVQLVGDIAGHAVYAGTINPNNNVTAPVGSIYLRENSGTDGRIYKKTGGTGSTTWEEMLSTDAATVDTKTAPAAGNAAALPATPNGYMTVMVQGVARKIAYY